MRTGIDLASPCAVFDRLGKLEFPLAWDGTEAHALRLGQRSNVNPDARERGRQIRYQLLDKIEKGRLEVDFYLRGDRVPYRRARTKQITDVFPCPTNDPDIGFIELDNKDICPALIDISGLPVPPVMPRKRTGPKQRFHKVREACAEHFRAFGTTQTNSEVKAAVMALWPSNERWPQETRERELINEARELVRNEPIAIGNSEAIATDAL